MEDNPAGGSTTCYEITNCQDGCGSKSGSDVVDAICINLDSHNNVHEGFRSGFCPTGLLNHDMGSLEGRMDADLEAHAEAALLERARSYANMRKEMKWNGRSALELLVDKFPDFRPGPMMCAFISLCSGATVRKLLRCNTGHSARACLKRRFYLAKMAMVLSASALPRSMPCGIDASDIYPDYIFAEDADDRAGRVLWGATHEGEKTLNAIWAEEAPAAVIRSLEEGVAPYTGWELTDDFNEGLQPVYDLNLQEAFLKTAAEVPLPILDTTGTVADLAAERDRGEAIGFEKRLRSAECVKRVIMMDAERAVGITHEQRVSAYPEEPMRAEVNEQMRVATELNLHWDNHRDDDELYAFGQDVFSSWPHFKTIDVASREVVDPAPRFRASILVGSCPTVVRQFPRVGSRVGDRPWLSCDDAVMGGAYATQILARKRSFPDGMFSFNGRVEAERACAMSLLQGIVYRGSGARFFNSMQLGSIPHVLEMSEYWYELPALWPPDRLTFRLAELYLDETPKPLSRAEERAGLYLFPPLRSRYDRRVRSIEWGARSLQYDPSFVHPDHMREFMMDTYGGEHSSTAEGAWKQILYRETVVFDAVAAHLAMGRLGSCVVPHPELVASILDMGGDFLDRLRLTLGLEWYLPASTTGPRSPPVKISIDKRFFLSPNQMEPKDVKEHVNHIDDVTYVSVQTACFPSCPVVRLISSKNAGYEDCVDCLPIYFKYAFALAYMAACRIAAFPVFYSEFGTGGPNRIVPTAGDPHRPNDPCSIAPLGAVAIPDGAFDYKRGAYDFILDDIRAYMNVIDSEKCLVMRLKKEASGPCRDGFQSVPAGNRYTFLSRLPIQMPQDVPALQPAQMPPRRPGVIKLRLPNERDDQVRKRRWASDAEGRRRNYKKDVGPSTPSPPSE